MEFRADALDQTGSIVSLFQDSFTASEGAEEGQAVGNLAKGLIETTPKADIYGFSAFEGTIRAGCILFTRLTYPDDSARVFLLSPVAIRTDHQQQGVGQKLIRFGLDHLRAAQVDLVFTYGDPNYYAKTGFGPISHQDAQAPYPLQMPHGWLAQSLNGAGISPLTGPSTCAPALRDPALW